MTPLMLITLMFAAPATGGDKAAAAVPEPRQDAWDLRWMVGPWTGRPQSPPPRVTDELRGRGRALYGARCASCHGASGDGKGPLSARLRVPPTSFVAAVYKVRSTPAGSVPTDEDLFKDISRGVHGTPMAPWTDLSEADRWALVATLKSFSIRFREERPAPAVRVPAPPAEDEPLREKGRRLYRFMACANCHGAGGAGDGPGAKLYDGALPKDRDWRFRDFTRGRFIRGAEMEDIYLTLRIGIEGTPMASYDVLTNDDIWALAAYVRSLLRERPLHELPPARGRASLDVDGDVAPGTGKRATNAPRPRGRETFSRLEAPANGDAAGARAFPWWPPICCR